MSKKRKQNNRHSKNKNKINKEKIMSIDPIGVMLNTFKRNWIKFLLFIPFYVFTAVVIKFTMLNIYNVPIEYIQTMLAPSTKDWIGSFALIIVMLSLALLVEIIKKLSKTRILRTISYFVACLIGSIFFARVYGVGTYYIILFFLCSYTIVLSYIFLIRRTYEKKKRDISQKAYNVPNKMIKRFVFGSEMFGVVISYMLILGFAANIGVVFPKIHASLDGKVIIANSSDKYLVSDYTVKNTSSGTEYILIDVDEMEIVKTGKLNTIGTNKTFIRGESF